MQEPELAPRPDRRWVWAALALTAVAIPVVVIDNVPDDGGADADVVPVTDVVSPSEVPSDRPVSGPVKGVSVVTSSTTSSTVPITTSTTTTPT